MNSSCKDKLIQLCANPHIDQAAKEQVKELLKADLDWNYILNRAATEGVSSLLFYNLIRIEDTVLPPRAILQKLEHEYLQTTFRNLKFLGERDRILQLLQQTGIPALGLKGGFLIDNVYHNLSLRPMSDLDILIKKEHLDQVHQQLIRLGYTCGLSEDDIYRRQSQTSRYLNSVVYTRHEDLRLCLNLHWHLHNSGFPLYMHTNIQMEKIWQQTKVGANGQLTMAPHHLLIHLAEHAFRHGFNRLNMLVDITQVVRFYGGEIDWPALANDSFKFGLSKRVFYSLYLEAGELGAGIPKETLAALNPRKRNCGERVFLKAILSNKRFEELACLGTLSMCENLLQRMHFLWRLILPPREVLAYAAVKKKGQINPLDYLLRMIRGTGYIWRGYFQNAQNSW